jgi:uncharacterized protein YjbI with pentapeptide repeats
MERANLEGANLDRADLRRTHLEGARFSSVEHVKAAQNWQEAFYDVDFQSKLGIVRPKSETQGRQAQ